DHQYAERPRSRAGGAAENRSRARAGFCPGSISCTPAVRRPLRLHRVQAGGGLLVHRRDRRGVHHLEPRHRLRDLLRVQQFRQPGDVRDDPVHPAARHHGQHVAPRLGEAAAFAPPARMKWRDPLILVFLIVILWQVLYALIGDVALRSPATTAHNLGTLLSDPRFLPHINETSIAFAQGFAIGVPLGAARFAGEVAEPILVALYSIPKVTLYPVILLVFGIGMPAKVAFGAIQGVVPISLFAMNAVRNINPTHLRTARALRLAPWTLFSRVLL